MIEVFCVLLIGLTPALAPMAEPPSALLGPGWTLDLKEQAFAEQVTRKPGQATVFEAAGEDFGTVGVLAHNYLEGRRFTTLVEGNQIGLSWEDGRRSWYQVVEIRAYLATYPGRENSTLVRKGEVLTEEQVYREVYSPPGRLILQTCVGMSGGFYFVIAEPLASRALYSSIDQLISVARGMVIDG
jgi:hypothetical protein